VKHNTLTGQVLRQMYKAGAERLTQHVKKVDALNVFPVPDGDTGTNMNLTFTSGAAELEKSAEQTVEKIASVFSRGLLMGARGNSGVILSQLFRGFAKGVAGKDEIGSVELAEAFGQGVEMAYKAVMKPVEGTILTVAREAASAARKVARTGTIEAVIETLVEAAQKALANTPNLLPVLKEVGVVDSGGQGLVYIYEGFLSVIKDDRVFTDSEETSHTANKMPGTSLFGETYDEVHHTINPADITYGYCTEFMVHLKSGTPFTAGEFREQISAYGDSLLVVSDDDLVKVHIHAEEPGEVLSFAQRYGALDRIKIENMRLQHEEVLRRQETRQSVRAQELPQTSSAPIQEAEEVIVEASLASEAKKKQKEYAIITVASGAGIARIFKSLGADYIIEGGQTMNPSTEQFVNAIKDANAERVIILPNNKNIIMAARQAEGLVDIPVAVVPSKSIPQGMSAMLAFSSEETLEKNRDRMSEALGFVKTGLVTYAVRDTTLNEITIKEGDFIGIFDNEIVTSGQDPYETAKHLIKEMVEEDDGVITVIYGSDVNEAAMDELVAQLHTSYSDYEVEVHDGGQPLYSFIIAVE
jgi:DAK2 domain fusion protein YloV